MNSRNLLQPVSGAPRIDLALLILRLAVGILMLMHGWGKLTGFGELVGKFADPIGLGPEISLILVVFAEVFCSIFLILGLGVRLTAIPPAITMLVAVFIIHADDPFAKQEIGLLFLFPYLCLLLAGAGRFSLDAVIYNKMHGTTSAQ